MADQWVDLLDSVNHKPKPNLGGTTSPIATDDANDGYAVGSVWIDTVNDESWVCTDPTPTLANWEKTSTFPINIDDLTDVDTTGKINTDVLAYNSSSGNWEPTNPSTPAAHATSHQDGNADEIVVTGLSGLLADGQTPLSHNTSHQDGGSDEISVTDLSGLLADGQTPLSHASTHQNGGADEISVAGLSGELADPQPSTIQDSTVGQGDAVTLNFAGNLSATVATGVATIVSTGGTDADAIHDNVDGEINALPLVTGVSGDIILIEDATDTFKKKKVNASDFLASLDTTAVHQATAGEIAGMTLVSAAAGDHIMIEDATDSDNKKRVNASDFLGTGDVTSDGTTAQDAALFTERADHVNTPAAGKAELWVSNDATQKLYFTDDAGADTDLTAAGGDHAIASAYLTAEFDGTDDTWVDIVWDVADEENNSSVIDFDGTGLSDFTIGETGVYLVTLVVEGNGYADRGDVRLAIDGTAVSGSTFKTTDEDNLNLVGKTTTVCMPMTLTATDVVTGQFLHTTGAATNDAKLMRGTMSVVRLGS